MNRLGSQSLSVPRRRLQALMKHLFPMFKPADLSVCFVQNSQKPFKVWVTTKPCWEATWHKFPSCASYLPLREDNTWKVEVKRWVEEKAGRELPLVARGGWRHRAVWFDGQGGHYNSGGSWCWQWKPLVFTTQEASLAVHATPSLHSLKSVQHNSQEGNWRLLDCTSQAELLNGAN